jgi:hypothetical protein
MRRWLAFSVLCATASVANRARAQVPEAPVGPELAQAGRVAISAERLFGFSYSSETQSMNGVELEKTTATSVSALGNPLGSLASFFSFPRLAVDAFVAPGLSVGAAVSVFHLSLSSTPTGGMSFDQSVTGFVLAPRVGYAVRVSPAFSIWPRVGVSFIYASTDSSSQGVNQGTSTTSMLAATFEAPLAFTVASRVVILFGPTFDLGLTGSNKNEPVGGPSTTTDTKDTEFGIQAGLLVLL